MIGEFPGETVATTFWLLPLLWKNRNNMIFNKSRTSPQVLARKAREHAIEHLTANVMSGALNPDLNKPLNWVRWITPNHNSIKIIFDALAKEGGEYTFGCIARNHKREIIKTKLGKKGTTTVSVAEMWAACKDYKLAMQIDSSSVFIEGDSLLIVKCLKREWRAPWNCHALLKDCHSVSGRV
uniref:RNase H type-1 domain-containing protein n=1 Tax=Nelumbo nucifera TaxID=4432 RepID=A0A822YMX7_NELNU|nr:TPA_asm: hypothetical protein HUJ06_012688 [Nelumbo nucifera]